MNPDNEPDENDDANRRRIELKIGRFCEQSQVYLCRLPLLKRQLHEINRLQQFDLYVQKLGASLSKITILTSSICSLDDIGKIVQSLEQNIRSLEQLHLQLNEKDRRKLDEQIRLLRADIDRELTEFHELRQQAMITSIDDETRLSTDIEPETNQLRQRKIANDNARLNESYDLLEQDLILLRDTMNEVAVLVAQQRQTITHTDYLIHSAHDQLRHASSLLQKAVHNKYITLASGALIGASLGGPVGFLMGIKIGALAALSGSAVGALSANIMQQRVLREDEEKKHANAYNQAMLWNDGHSFPPIRDVVIYPFSNVFLWKN